MMRPILFSAPMARALLAETKSQTRRAVKYPASDGKSGWHPTKLGEFGSMVYGLGGSDRPVMPFHRSDRLWVRETFRFCSTFDGDSPSRVGERCMDAGHPKPWAPIQYEADGHRDNWIGVGTVPGPVAPGKLRPGMFMPRWASRILLEVTDVRVERLQDISEADALAEGIAKLADGFGLPAGEHFHAADPRQSYFSLWETINGPGSVQTNPWVWAVSFKRLAALEAAK